MTEHERRELIKWLVAHYERSVHLEALQAKDAPKEVIASVALGKWEAEKELAKRAVLITEFKAECMRMSALAVERN